MTKTEMLTISGRLMREASEVGLRERFFTPPMPVFPIAWTAIEAALAYGGYRLLRSEPSPERTTALALWVMNQVGIGGWSKVFLGQRSPGWGAIASAGSYLGVPPIAWRAFATLLSEEI